MNCIINTNWLPLLLQGASGVNLKNAEVAEMKLLQAFNSRFLNNEEPLPLLRGAVSQHTL